MGKKYLSKKEKKRLKYLKSLETEEEKEVKEYEKKKIKIPKISKTWLVIILIFLAIVGYSIYSNVARPQYTPIKTDSPFVGNPNANVTIIEYSDFQCSYCAQFHKTTYPEIRDKYISTGKVKFVFKNFLIEQIYTLSNKAAQAARCAYEQDRFEEYALNLYNKQNEWSKLGVSKFKDYAKQFGLNMTAFNQCLDSGAMEELVKRDFEEGKKNGITGTPSFLINKKRIIGAKPFDDFQKIIDAELGITNSTQS